MIFGPCPACAAKNAEIARLVAQLDAANARTDKQAAEMVELARDATGHSRRLPPAEPPLPSLPDLVQEFLDMRHGRGTPLWKHQCLAARKLVEEGLQPLAVRERLIMGQRLEL